MKNMFCFDFATFPVGSTSINSGVAGVGLGMLIGDRGYLARKQRNWLDLPHFRFMFFNRNEIHTQAFGDFETYQN